MKSKILIISLLFLTTTTALSLYHLIYLNDFNSTQHSLDLSLFKSADIRLNEEMFRIRATMGANPIELEQAFENFKNQKNIVISFLKESNIDPVAKSKFESYFQKKETSKNEILFAINTLNKNLNELNPIVNKFPQKNIRFILDNKDFYKELVINAHRYVLVPSSENTERFIEDKKVLQQIKAYSNVENLEISKLFEAHNNVFDKVNILNSEFNSIKTANLETEINTITNELLKSVEDNQDSKNYFLIITIIIGIFYSLSVIIFLR